MKSGVSSSSVEALRNGGEGIASALSSSDHSRLLLSTRPPRYFLLSLLCLHSLWLESSSYALIVVRAEFTPFCRGCLQLFPLPLRAFLFFLLILFYPHFYHWNILFTFLTAMPLLWIPWIFLHFVAFYSKGWRCRIYCFHVKLSVSPSLFRLA